MQLNEDRRKLLDRLAKLLAMADRSGFDNEANTARRKAEELMAELGLDRQAVSDQTMFEVEVVKPYYDTDVQWDRILKFAVAELNGCLPLLRFTDDTETGVEAHIYVGRRIDIDSALYMIDELRRQRTKAQYAYAAEGGTDGKAKFYFGYAKGVEARVENIEARLAANAQAQGKPTPVGRRQELHDWYERTHGKIESGLKTFGGRGSGAGYDAGSGAAFTRGAVTKPAARIGGPRG